MKIYCSQCGSLMKLKSKEAKYDTVDGRLQGWWGKYVCPKWWLMHNSDYKFIGAKQ